MMVHSCLRGWTWWYFCLSIIKFPNDTFVLNWKYSFQFAQAIFLLFMQFSDSGGIYGRGPDVDPLYLMCWLEVKPTEHALFFCLVARSLQPCWVCILSIFRTSFSLLMRILSRFLYLIFTAYERPIMPWFSMRFVGLWRGLWPCG